VKRRALLSAVAAGSVAGCLGTNQEPAILGFTGSVEVTVCGKVIRNPCKSVDSVDVSADIPEQISSRGGEHTGVRVENNQLRIEGDIPGVGDQWCRQTRVVLVELTQNRKIRVIVKNNWSEIASGCTENSRLVRYAITVNSRDSNNVDSVQVKHYDFDGSLSLSGSVEL
jgi:hypothetical protein